MKRAAVLFGGSGALLAPRRTSAQTAPAVRIVAVVGNDFAAGFFASEQGFFKDQRLDVALTTIASGGAATAALIGGSYDVAITNVGSVSSAFVRGLPLAILGAAGALYSSDGPSAFLVAAPSSAIRTAKDFAGKTVGLSSLRDLAQVAVMSWIDQNGGDSHAGTFVEMPPLDIIASVERGRIDAGLIINPRYIQAKDDVRLIATPYDAVAKQFLISAPVTTRSWLAANRPAATRLAAALRATARWSGQNGDASNELIAKYTKIPIDLVRKTARAPLAPDIEPQMLQPLVDALAKYGFIPRRFRAADVIAKV